MKLRSVLTAAAVVLAPCAASAGVTGQATLNHFSYTLIDLDPNDGVTPSITFLPAARPGAINIQYGVGNSSHSPFSDGPSASYQEPGVSAGASFSGLDMPGSASLTAFASASADQAGGQQASAWANAASALYIFVLSPHTALNVSADVEFSGQVTAGGETNRLDMDGDIWVSGWETSGLSSQFSTDSGIFRNPTDPFDRMASVLGTYSNDSTASFNGSLLLYTTVDALSIPSVGTAPPPPVPEPAEVVMLAAGLPLLLGLRRRAGRDTRR